MAFSNPTGGVITQSGSDTQATTVSLLTSVPGVTVRTSGTYTTIDLGLNRIDVTGTMVVNPNAVTFLGRNNSGVFNVRSTGTLTAISSDFSSLGLNTATGLAARTSFENPFIISFGAAPSWHHSGPGTGAPSDLISDYGPINISEDGGVLLLDGVTITANTGFTVGAAAPGTFTHATRGVLPSGMINSNYIMPGYASGSTTRGTIIQTYDDNSSFALTNTRIVGGEYLPNKPVTISNLARSGSTAALFNAGRGQGSIVIRDFDFQDNVNDYIYSSFDTNLAQTWMYNSSNGSNMNISGPTTNGSGIFALYKEINTNIVDIAGAGVDDVKVFIRDYNNGARKSTTGAQLIATNTDSIDLTSFPTNFNRTGTTSTNATFPQTSDYIYEATTDSSGVITDVNYTNGASVVNDATATNGLEFMVMNAMGVNAGGPLVPWTTTFVGTLFNSTKAVDKRTKVNTLGTDTIDAFTYKYENNIGVFSDINLVGTGQAIINETKILDPGVTNTRAVTSALYTANPPSINNTGSVILPAVALDLDQVYDLIKWNKTETGVTGYETPSQVNRLTIGGLLRANPAATTIVFGDALNITGNTGAVFTAAAALSNGTNHSVVQFDTINMGNQAATGITLDTATITNLGDTTDCVLDASSVQQIDLAGTHTRTDIIAGSYGTGAGVTMVGGSAGGVTIGGSGSYTATTTAFAATNITVSGTKVLTGTTGTPRLNNTTALTLVNNSWTTGSSITVTTGVLNLDGGSYATLLNGNISTAQTWNWNNMAANSINFNVNGLGGAGIITIIPDAASLAEAQRWYGTIGAAQSRFVVQPPVVNVSLTVEGITGGLAAVRTLGGFFVWKQGTSGSLNTVVVGASTTAAQLTVTRADTVTDTFHAWYIAASPSPLGSRLYDYNYVSWTPSTSGNAVLAPFEPDPTGIVVSGISTDTFALTAAASLDANGRGRYTITEVAGSFNIADTLALGRAIWNTRLYIESVATATLDNDNRPFAFISTAGGAGLSFALLASGSSLVELFSSTSVKTLANVANIRTVDLATAAGVPSVTTSSTILAVSPIADVTIALDANDRLKYLADGDISVFPRGETEAEYITRTTP